MATPAHRLILGVYKPVYRLFGRVTWSGRDKVPPGGGVLVFNHPRNRDPLDVQAAWGKPLYFLGKKEAFDIPVIGKIFRDIGGNIPLDRAAGNNLDALREAVMRLKTGNKICLAPEGTKSNDGPLGRGRSGAVRMAWAAGVPIIPVAVIHKGLDTHVRFGAPIDLSNFSGDASDPAEVRRATDFMMTLLAAHIGEPYDPATAPDYAGRKGFPTGKAPEKTQP